MACYCGSAEPGEMPEIEGVENKMKLLDLDLGVISLVMRKSLAKDLIALAATCRVLRDLAFDGNFAEKLWKNHCDIALGDELTALHKEAAAIGQSKELFLRRLYGQSRSLASLCWYENGSEAIAESDVEELAARAGHASVSLDANRVVISGGLKHFTNGRLDLILVDLREQKLRGLEASGSWTCDRFRHCTVLIKPSEGSLIWTKAKSEIDSRQDLASGFFVAVIGGRRITPAVDALRPNILEVVWLNQDATYCAWVHVPIQGQQLETQWHHTANAFEGGKKVVVCGGEPCQGTHDIHILDVNSLCWIRYVTASASGCKSLHCSCIWQDEATGAEHLVIVGGIKEGQMANMQPHTLNLKTMTWSPPVNLNNGHHIPSPMPQGRQRASCCLISKDWLVIHGGCPDTDLMSVERLLDDTWALHLPTSQWHEVRVQGFTTTGKQGHAGHTLSGHLAFGGCCMLGEGLSLLYSTDILLLGNPEGYQPYE